MGRPRSEIQYIFYLHRHRLYSVFEDHYQLPSPNFEEGLVVSKGSCLEAVGKACHSITKHLSTIGSCQLNADKRNKESNS
jgi:hypothetical protein